MYGIRMTITVQCIKMLPLIFLKVADVPEELTWFQYAVENPPSLQHLSRLLIRKVLRTSLPSKVKQLPLPNRLKNYILLQDVFQLYDGRSRRK